jgi:hypothetical protein
MDANTVIATATSVYGAATLLLVFQIWRDRVQRERHYREEAATHKLNELRSAFYEACGFWEGGRRIAGVASVDASQVGREFEALIRLECQLRLNDYKVEANNLGFVIRARFNDIRKELGKVGVALGLLPSEYREFTAVGFER